MKVIETDYGFAKDFKKKIDEFYSGKYRVEIKDVDEALYNLGIVHSIDKVTCKLCADFTDEDIDRIHDDITDLECFAFMDDDNVKEQDRWRYFSVLEQVCLFN